ncbi:MAG: M56 family metallopeptidase [Acidobacteriota bacterium]
MSPEVLGFFAVCALKALGLSVLCGGLFLTLRHQAPRSRASFLALVTVTFLTLPLLVGFLPKWGAPSFVSVAVSPVDLPREPSASQDPSSQGTARPAGPAVSLPEPAGVSETGGELSGLTIGPAWQRAAAELRALPWGLLAFTLWLVGAVAVLTHTLWALAQLELLRRRAVPVSASAGDVPVVEAPLRSAVTFGVLRPVIVLPRQWRRWTRERLDVVLAHELEHVRRFDWTWRLVGELTASLYWPLPLAWAALRRLRLEQELSCDRAVVSSGLVGATQYGDHLIDLATTRGPSAALAATIVHKTTLEERLMKLQESSEPRRRWAAVPCVLVLLIAAPLLAALGAEEPVTPELKEVLQQLDDLHAELEPLEARLHEQEQVLHPHMNRLEEKSREMEREFARFESERAREMEKAMEERARRLEELHRAAEVAQRSDQDELVAAERQLHELGGELHDLAIELEKAEREAALGRGDDEARRSARARVARKQEEIMRINEQVAARHREMRHDPETMAAMERLQAELAELSEAHAREVEKRHADLEPLQREMEKIQEEMTKAHKGFESVHEELARVHERIEPVLERLQVAQRKELSRRFETVFGRAPSAGTLDRLDRDVDWQIRDGALRLRGSAATLRELLVDEYPDAAAATIEGFVLDLLSLDVEI